MKKINIFILFLFLSILIVLNGCSGQETEKLSFAEIYLLDTSDDEILNEFIKITYVGTGDYFGFSSSNKISSNDLIKIAVMSANLETEKNWYDKSKNN